jgi:hypothetical protein
MASHVTRAPAAVLSIDHFALTVPSITDAQRFFYGVWA